MAADSIIRGLLNKGKAVRNIEEPWWSKRYGDILGGIAEIPQVIQQAKQRKQQQASRDLTTISGFEARLGNKVNNYVASGDIYDESKISALKDSVNSLYDQHSSKFPELISEFSDERDSALGIINNYSTKNKEKDSLLSKIEPTKKKLYSIAKRLNTTLTEDMTPDEKVKFRQEVYDTMEEITRLDKIIDDPYFSNLSGWADVAEDVKYGLSDASKQLITQINTWDSKENVISKQDLENLENAIFKNDTAGIRAINEQIGADKKARTTNYETEYVKSLKEYESINSFFASTAFQRTLDERNKAYNEASKEEKKKMDLDPEYWRVYNIDVPGLPDEGVDITQDVHIPLLRAKARAEKIDADYRNEHITGSSIAEILNTPLPWSREEKKHPRVTTPEQLQDKIKETMRIDLPEKDVTPEQKAETARKRRQLLGVLPSGTPEDPEIYSSSEKILEGYIKGDVSADSLREIGGQSLLSDADRIKSAAKGQKPKYTVIPGVKTRERAPIDVETLKTLEFSSKAGRYSWHDVVNKIYAKKERGLSVADDYLSGDVGIEDFKLTYRTRRDRAEKIKQNFQKLGVSLEEFKKKYSKDYETLTNLLGKSRTR